jgi:hypothetical protein
VPGSFYSSPICAGRHLCNISREGDFIVLAASKRYELLASNRLSEGSHSTPALAAGRLYVRTYGHLLALEGKQPRP